MKSISARSQKQIDRCVRQVGALVRSPSLSQYLVGITANERTRRSSYEGIGFQYFFILETGLSREQALMLESALYDRIREDKTLARKYHAEKHGGHRASTGGQIHECYCVYVAAFAP